MTSILQISEEFARKEYAKHDEKHQWGHVEEVMTVALKLANYYSQTDLEILKLAILFHDICYDNYITHIEKSMAMAKQFLLKHHYPENRIQLVLDVILAHSGPHRKKFGDTKLIEGKIIFDADKFRAATTPEGFVKYGPRFYLNETREILKKLSR